LGVIAHYVAEAISNPGYKLCRTRLMRELSEMSAEMSLVPVSIL
jgi:hypothetical protein